MSTKILLIEDNPDHALLTQKALKRTGLDYEVDYVSECKEGLEKILNEGYDLILCDYRLPGLSALDILKEMKERGKDLPFVVVTASGNEKVAVELMKEGAYDYVLKDLSYEDILPVVISKSIEKYKLKKDNERSKENLEKAYRQLKETQQQLIQSSKMVAIGQLAAGISHELNQPLTGIKGFAQAALMDLNGNASLGEDLKKIIEQANRMDRIIKNIRFFARKSEFTMEDVDINRPIEDSLMLLQEQLKVHNIRLKTHLDENLPRIKGDPNQLQQVFLNLITNARDAIDCPKGPHGGQLTIGSGLSEDKKSIKITFQDTGCGIPQEDLENIFNPFFTTKSPDEGIGLGLSIVYRIVENHQGKIRVESQLGKGTSFEITLPIE